MIRVSLCGLFAFATLKMTRTIFATAIALAVFLQIVVGEDENDHLVRNARYGGRGGSGGYAGSPGMPGQPGGSFGGYYDDGAPGQPGLPGGYDYPYSKQERDWIKLLLEKYLADSSLPSYRNKPDYLAMLSYYYPYYFPAYFGGYGGLGGRGGAGGGGAGGAAGMPGMPGY